MSSFLSAKRSIAAAKGVAILALLGGFVLYLVGVVGQDDKPGILDDDETFTRAAVGSLWLVGECNKSSALCSTLATGEGIVEQPS